MIKKLRRKFILISALSVLFVLAVTIGAINISNYLKIENDSTSSLNVIIATGFNKQGPGSVDPSQPGGGEKRPERMLREHYFLVSFNESGTINRFEKEMQIISDIEAKELAAKVFKNEISGGKYGDFRYSKTIKSDGLTYVAFVDIKEKMDNFKNFLLVSSLVSTGAYFVLIGLIILASKIAFKSSEEAYRKQKRFITNASHELKTPLTVISTDLDLIEMDNGKSEWSESIRDQLKRLTEMTNQLVTLSKLEEDDPKKFPFADFSLSELGKNIAESFAPSFKNEGIKFAYNFVSGVTMYGNQKLIDELIHIFLENSLKYTGGEAKSSYFVISQNQKGKIELRFSNSLDKDDEIDVKQIMDRFYRSPSVKKEGSGIGLSIAKEIIDLHKGKIEVDKNSSVINFVVKFN